MGESGGEGEEIEVRTEESDGGSALHPGREFLRRFVVQIAGQIQTLREKLQAEVSGVKVASVAKEVDIAQSASGDGYYEIGGPFKGRVSSGQGKVTGVKVWL